MYLKEELWLIIVGLIVAWVVQKTSHTAVSYKRIALFACSGSLALGLFGMLVKGIQPSLAFFPTDVRGLLITSFAAFFMAKFTAAADDSKVVEPVNKRKRATRRTKKES